MPTVDLTASMVESLKRVHAVEVKTGWYKEMLMVRVIEVCGFAPLHNSCLAPGLKIMTFQSKLQKEQVLAASLSTKNKEAIWLDIGTEIRRGAMMSQLKGFGRVISFNGNRLIKNLKQKEVTSFGHYGDLKCPCGTAEQVLCGAKGHVRAKCPQAQPPAAVAKPSGPSAGVPVMAPSEKDKLALQKSLEKLTEMSAKAREEAAAGITLEAVTGFLNSARKVNKESLRSWKAREADRLQIELSGALAQSAKDIMEAVAPKWMG
ncbi:hypothetical protein L0F63_000846, partial [Massospora cicadina]